MISKLKNELFEVYDMIKKYELWIFLSWSDIKSRYRRTMIGPFWLVIANAVTICGISLVWSTLFNINIVEYVPKFSAALICWLYISTCITDAGDVFIRNENVIKNLPINYYLYPIRMIMRNIFTLLHNFVVYIAVLILFKPPINMSTLLFVPNFILITFSLLVFSFWSGLIGLRFRDIPHIITAIMSIMIFLTPVMWDMEMLGDKAQYIYLNPLASYLILLKYPLIGRTPPMLSYLIVWGTTIANFAIMIYFAMKHKKKIPFWC